MRFQDKRLLSIASTDDMVKIIESKGNSMKEYKKGTKITVYNKMEKGYSYVLAENPGKNFAEGFEPYYTPAEMLEMGVFSGKYLNDCLLEFPKEWFLKAIKKGKLSPQSKNTDCNFLKVDSRLPLQSWEEYGWVPNKGGHVAKQFPLLSNKEVNHDIRGWFQWYCRYYMGRREPEIDSVQIKRWRAFKRHAGQIKANCKKGDLSCRPVQRQALLQWAHQVDM
jgi:hypothetical protein